MIKFKCLIEGRNPSSLLFVIFIMLVCLSASFFAPPAWAQPEALENLRNTGKAFAGVAKKVSPAVVFIKVEKTVTSASPYGPSMPFGDDFFRRFFNNPFPGPQSPQQKRLIQGQGSGFIISTDGYILTNNHVVGDADNVIVKLIDGREFKARTIGTDPHTDVAVIKIDATHLPVLPLGDSDALEVGEWVLAIGNPFGLSHTLTAGIVSAKGRSSLGIADYEDFIQTDAAINPGNSGGPLVDLEGRAIGINTAICSQTGGYMGIGFAIPINMAKNIRDQLIKHGSVTRGYLGIMVQDITPELAETFGLETAKGVLISEVTKGSPAEKADLARGDVIVEFNGHPVENVGSFRNEVALVAPGTRVNLAVIRHSKRQSNTVKIGKLPVGKQAVSTQSDILDKLGLTVETLTRDQATQLGYQDESGVVVTGVDSASVAALAGIRPGVLIQEVNRKRVHNVEEFDDAVALTASKGAVLLLVKEGGGGGSRYVILNFNR